MEALLPTLNARDWKGPPGKGSRARGGRKSSLPSALSCSAGGTLHPRFAEFFMGFPIGWTDLDEDDDKVFVAKGNRKRPPNDKERIRCLGNAVVPPVAFAVGRFIVEAGL